MLLSEVTPGNVCLVERDVNNIAIYGFEVALKLMYICTRSTTYIYNQVSTYRSRSWQKAR